MASQMSGFIKKEKKEGQEKEGKEKEERKEEKEEEENDQLLPKIAQVANWTSLTLYYTFHGKNSNKKKKSIIQVIY
jgi:hypothetical protein